MAAPVQVPQQSQEYQLVFQRQVLPNDIFQAKLSKSNERASGARVSTLLLAKLVSRLLQAWVSRLSIAAKILRHPMLPRIEFSGQQLWWAPQDCRTRKTIVGAEHHRSMRTVRLKTKSYWPLRTRGHDHLRDRSPGRASGSLHLCD